MGRLIIRSAVLCAASWAWLSFADEGAVDYRHHTMEAIGGHMQAIGDIVRQKVDHIEHLPIHANALADLAPITRTLFPEGSEGGETKDEVWEDPEDFEEKLVAFEQAAPAFRDAVAGGDPEAIGPALRQLGGSCKGCHDDYRDE